MSQTSNGPRAADRTPRGKTTCLVVGLGRLVLAVFLSLPLLGLLMFYKDDVADWVNSYWERRIEETSHLDDPTMSEK
ncbi:MAG: hypothetical protein JXL80_12705 [Planctomycetes bacterium]|nr:hypothetical protein [Planctomycetota bacterium]